MWDLGPSAFYNYDKETDTLTRVSKSEMVEVSDADRVLQSTIVDVPNHRLRIVSTFISEAPFYDVFAAFRVTVYRVIGDAEGDQYLASYCQSSLSKVLAEHERIVAELKICDGTWVDYQRLQNAFSDLFK